MGVLWSSCPSCARDFSASQPSQSLVPTHGSHTMFFGKKALFLTFHTTVGRGKVEKQWVGRGATGQVQHPGTCARGSPAWLASL